MQPFLVHSRIGRDESTTTGQQLVVDSSDQVLLSKRHQRRRVEVPVVHAQGVRLDLQEVADIRRCVAQAGPFGLADWKHDSLDRSLGSLAFFLGDAEARAHSSSAPDVTDPDNLSGQMVVDLVAKRFEDF